MKKENKFGLIPGMGRGVELLNELRPYVRQCGARRRGAWKLGERKLLDFLLVYIEEGQGRFVIDGESYDVVPGDLYCIPPATTHFMEGYAPTMVCPFVHFDLVYRPIESHWDFSIPEGMLDLSDFSPLMHPPVTKELHERLSGKIETYTNQRVGSIIHEIVEEASRAQPYSQLIMSGLMLNAIAEIFRGQDGVLESCNAYVSSLEGAAEYIRIHCSEQVSMDIPAKMCSIAPSYFRRLFRLQFGCSPRDYLRRARIQMAKELMLTSRLNMTEIAFKVGYATVHSFSRAFRAEEGIAPSQYRVIGE